MKTCCECDHSYIWSSGFVECCIYGYVIENPKEEAEYCALYKHDDDTFGQESEKQ